MHRGREWIVGVAVGGLIVGTPSVVSAQVWESDAGNVPSDVGASGRRGAGEEAERFWSVFGDPTLDRLIAQAVAGNYELRAAEARVEGAEAQRLNSALELAPIVTANGGFTRRRFANSTFPGLGTGALPDESVWESGLTATWEVDVFGRLRGDVRARGAITRAAEEDVRDARITVTAAVARAYFDRRGAQEQLAVAQRNAENQRRTLDLTLSRLAAGRGNEFDAERARAQLNVTLAAIPLLETDVAVADARIAVLLGRSPRDLDLGGPGGLPELPDSVPLARQGELVRARPDVLGAARRLDASHDLVGAARADYLPRLSVAAGAGYTTRAFDQFGSTGTFNYAVGPVISWAAFDMGRVKARVDEAHAQEAEARARYEHTVLLAEEELEAASARYHRARARLTYLEDAAAASGRAAALAALRYQGGVADFLQVLDAERTLLTAEDQLASGRTAAAEAYVDLYDARGGVWAR